MPGTSTSSASALHALTAALDGAPLHAKITHQHHFTSFGGNTYNVEVMNPVSPTPEVGGLTLSA